VPYSRSDDVISFPNAALDAKSIAISGAQTIGGALTVTGVLTVNNAIVGKGTSTVGTAFSMSAGMCVFLGSQNNQAVILPSGKCGYGAICTVKGAGTGTITLTGSGAEPWTAAGGGTGTITPGKYVTLVSINTGWFPIYASL